jgi:hypothetical protein
VAPESATLKDPWPTFDDPRTRPEMHTQQCLDYAETTAVASGHAFCIAICADERRAALTEPGEGSA